MLLPRLPINLRSRLRVLLPLIASPLFALGACSTPGRSVAYESARALVPSGGRVLTNLDLLAGGREQVEDYMAQLSAPLALRMARAIQSAEAASIRIQARHVFSGTNSFTQNNGSGVLVASKEGAIVLTAGHTLVGTAADLQVMATSVAGRTARSTLIESGSNGTDFALLRHEDEGFDPLSAVAAAEPRKGELVMALGYPDRYGVREDGLIVHGQAYEDRPLGPLLLLLEVVSTQPLLLAPVAGAMPLGGFSGGGLFDLDGHVIGVLTGVEWEAGREEMIVRVTGCSATAPSTSLLRKSESH